MVFCSKSASSLCLRATILKKELHMICLAHEIREWPPITLVAIQSRVLQQSGVARSEPKKLWGGRFTGTTDPLMEKFNESLPFDKRLWKEDILVSYSAAAAIMCGEPLCSRQ